MTKKTSDKNRDRANFRERVERLNFLLEEIRARPHTSKSLVQEWKTQSRNGVYVTPKTIQRDISFLNEFGAQISFNRKSSRYVCRNTDFIVPFLSLDKEDIQAVQIAHKALYPFRNTPFYENIEEIFKRLGIQPPSQGTDDPVSFSFPFAFFAPRRVDRDILDRVLRAAYTNRTIHLVYKSPRHEKTVTRDVDPYRVQHYWGEWYIIGMDHDRNALRTFAVSRIKDIKVLKHTFTRKKDTLTENGDTPFGFSDKETAEVRIRFARESAEYAKERIWHPDQTLKELKDGSVELSFRTQAGDYNLREIKRWVLSLGPAAEVTAPEKLVTMVTKEVRKLAGIYA